MLARTAARSARRECTARSQIVELIWPRISPEQTIEFTRELRSLGLPVRYHRYANAKGEWRAQLDTGLEWAFRP